MYVNLGKVKPGSTIFIPFHTFDSNDPSASVTITGLAVTDIEVYKDANMTQRASDSGYALVDTDGIDLDGITGIHGVTIDLSDDTTADFWKAGSNYVVVISSITVDAATINFIPVRFSIGYEGAFHETFIATLASQTSFTLTAGSADDNAYNGCKVIVHDKASGIQFCMGYVSDYTGSTKTVTLAADPAIFTMAAGDNISFFPPDNVMAVNGLLTAGANLQSACSNYSATRGLTGTAVPAAAADAAGGLPISDAGGLDLDSKLANTNEVTAARMGALTDWINGGRLDLLLDAIKVVTDIIAGMYENSSGYRFTAKALEESPTGSGGDATAANQNTIINHLTDLKGATFDSSTDSLEAIRNRGDVAWLTGGGLSGSNSVVLTIQAPSGTNVVGAFVDIFDSGNTSFYGRLITNSSGQVTFNADNGTYTVRILKAGYVFTNQTLVVDGTEAVIYTGTSYAPASPSSPNICRVYEYARRPDGTLVNVDKAFGKITTLPFNSGGALYVGQLVKAKFDDTGDYIYWEFPYTSSVTFNIEDLGVKNSVKTIPSSATARFYDIA